MLSALHAQIQDAFNEFGVQIMAPNFEAQPEHPVVVPRDVQCSPPALDPDPRGPIEEPRGPIEEPPPKSSETGS